jgi:hypothetical protein
MILLIVFWSFSAFDGRDHSVYRFESLWICEKARAVVIADTDSVLDAICIKESKP